MPMAQFARVALFLLFPFSGECAHFRALADSQESPADLVREGSEQLKKDDHEGAIRTLTRAIELDPTNILAHYVRGLARHGRREFKAAIEDFSRALALNPRFCEGYMNRGVSRASSGDLDGAIADYSAALKISPSYRQAYLNRGTALGRKGDGDGAIADYSVLIAMDPGDWRAYYNRGVIKASKGSLKGALDDYSDAIKFRPDFVEAHLNRGVAREKLGDSAGAIEDFSRVIVLDPGHVGAYYNRAVALGRLARTEQAREELGKVITLDPRHGLAVAMRARIHYDTQSWEGALLDLRRLCELETVDEAPYRLRIWLVRSRQGQRAQASAELKSFLDAKAKGAGEPWNRLAAEFLLGLASEEQLLAGAGSIDPARATHRAGEAYLYAGTKKLLDGDPEGARERFGLSAARGQIGSAATESALAELRELGD